MKIFGLELTRVPKKDVVTVRNVTPSATPISQIPVVPPRALTYAQTYKFGRGSFHGGEYDLAEIGKVEDTDSYVRKAFQKKLSLMFKEGYSYRGAQTNTIRYIKTRLAQIGQASETPPSDLLKRIAASLIRTSNGYLIKVRSAKASGGAKRKTANNKTLQPVAAYFPAAPETMEYEVDQNTGKITRWKQRLPGGLYKIFPVEDVVHFSINRREGFHLGVPDLVPVIDDVRTLRHIEENIELLVYQYLFPLFHYKVGTETAPAGYTEDGEKEIDVVLEQIKYLPSEGAIVTPERHEINAIGAEGRALRAEGYLTHFKKRVFSGLGVSDVDMGESDTSNRATALTLSRQLIDTVKAIQDELEVQWDQKIISELLLESTFGERVLEEENMVHLQFHEIDINSKIELAKHFTELFKANALTYDEYRGELGFEPIEVPTSGEDQDPETYPDWFKTYWKLFEEPLNLIRAVDEPYTAAAKAMAESRSVSMTPKQASESSAETQKAAQAAKAAQGAKKDFLDSFLGEFFADFEADSIQRVTTSMLNKRVVDKDWLMASGYTWVAAAMDRMRGLAFSELTSGFNTHSGGRAPEAFDWLAVARTEVEGRIERYLTKLVVNAVSLVVRRVDAITGDVKLPEVQKQIVAEIRLAFDSLRYRADLIWDVELRKANNYGRILAARFLGQQGFYLVAAPGGCEECQAVNGRFIAAATASLGDMPPLHPHSKMQMVVAEDGEGDSVAEEDGAKLDRCVKSVKAQLRKKNPGKSEKEITSSAFAICRSQLKE